MKNRIASTLGFAFFALAARHADAQAPVWIRQLGTSGGDVTSAATSDGSGGVYVTGATEGSLGGPNAGLNDAFLAHYDGAGNPTWIKQLGTGDDDHAYASAPDGSGGVFISGITRGSLGGPTAGNWDAWVAHYDAGGIQAWKRQLGTTNEDYAYAVASDGAGGVFMTGSTYGSLGGLNTNALDVWIARYDSLGNQSWIRQIGTGTEEAFTASPDGSGGVYVSGYTSGSLGGPIAGGKDSFLAHYDGAGGQTWIRQLGTSADDIAHGSAPDSTGGVYVTGYTKGSLGGQSAGLDDAWLARYDATGNQTWIRQLGTSGRDFAIASARDESGGVFIGGPTYGSLGGPNAGLLDAWLAHYDDVGNQTWIGQLGTNDDDHLQAGASDGLGGVCVGGFTYGSLGGPNAGIIDSWLARYGPTPVVYCNSKLNSAGCSPTIGWSGTATASGPTDDFHVTASSVLNRKPGIMLWSTLPAATPFGGGTLCLAPPVIRTPGQLSGGSPAPAVDCTGQYSFHFGHSYIQTYFLGVGQTIRAQYWSRDPGFATPNNIGLTAGLSFVICP